MKTISSDRLLPDFQPIFSHNVYLQGYSFYPDSEDIYQKFYHERDIDPENPLRHKTANEPDHIDHNNEQVKMDPEYGDDLDVPGSELDDPEEIIGNEDEENNYYSIGGDDHNDLDEDQGLE